MKNSTQTAAKKLSLPHSLRLAVLATLVAVVLGIPMVALGTTDQNGSLILVQRWPWLLWLAIVIFVGRLFTAELAAHGVVDSLKTWLSSRHPNRPKFRDRNPAILWLRGKLPEPTVTLLLLAFLLPMMPFTDRYSIDLATTVLIYVMLGWGLNIVVGLAGLLDLGYVAFYAVGAYSYAIISQTLGLGFWETLPIAGLLAALFGILLGFPVLRLRGDYLAIVTLGFGEIIRIILLNWQSLTNGSRGIGGIARPEFFGLSMSQTAGGDSSTFVDWVNGNLTMIGQWFGGSEAGLEAYRLSYAPVHRITFLYFVILGLLFFTDFLVRRLRNLPIGRAWEALREDEIACRALGINPTMVKLSAFALGAGLGGLAGCFFAARQGFISPESFTFMESATVLAIVVLGGMGSQIGVVVAALFLVLVPELGRAFADYRMVGFGAAMVLIMVFRPEGFVGERKPSLILGLVGKAKSKAKTKGVQ
ncbi:MAG: high-affinity branched-chain amino acid ABC transporter permease LivM [Candidatus Pacebacteria bacterium]|nr:high-affinity branched-chain amino acid ABC transporter permease LivM [Candidatus Paceibacterota bacterium]